MGLSIRGGGVDVSEGCDVSGGGNDGGGAR